MYSVVLLAALAGGDVYTNCWGGCSGFYPWNPGVFSPSAPIAVGPEQREMSKPETPEKPERPDEKPPKKKEPPGVAAPAPARLLVQVPPGARLLIDGQPSRSTAAVRLITTPALEPG